MKRERLSHRRVSASFFWYTLRYRLKGAMPRPTSESVWADPKFTTKLNEYKHVGRDSHQRTTAAWNALGSKDPKTIAANENLKCSSTPPSSRSVHCSVWMKPKF